MPFPFWEGDSLFLSFFRITVLLESHLTNLQSKPLSFNDLWQLPSLPLSKVLTKPVAWLISEKDAANFI